MFVKHEKIVRKLNTSRDMSKLSFPCEAEHRLWPLSDARYLRLTSLLAIVSCIDLLLWVQPLLAASSWKVMLRASRDAAVLATMPIYMV